MTNRFFSARRRRAASLAAVLAVAGGLAGCEGLLDVEDPQSIQPQQLNDPFYLNLLTNGVVSDFQRAFDDVAFFGGVFTDELRNHATFVEEPLIDQRDVTPNNGTAALLVYAQLQRARGLADSTAARIHSIRGDSAATDLRLARVLAYGGYTYVLMGETLCEAPVNVSRPYTTQELFKDFALPRFQEAIQVASAARAQAATRAGATAADRARIVASADTLLSLARVGAARAALNLGDRAQAAQFAASVPANFLFYAHYSDSATELNNYVWARLTNAATASVTGTPFQALAGADPRVPIPAVPTRTGRYIPNSPLAYTTYSGTLPGAEFERGSDIRLASGLEARYILAEVQGLTPDNLAFLNSRRAVAGQPALPAGIAPAEYAAELRDQRRRDFYLDTHRLGDLRRYRTQLGDNLEAISRFEQGSYYGSRTVNFADQYCFPVSAAERGANPFYD